jgi:hypothetical protein
MAEAPPDAVQAAASATYGNPAPAATSQDGLRSTAGLRILLKQQHTVSGHALSPEK